MDFVQTNFWNIWVIVMTLMCLNLVRVTIVGLRQRRRDTKFLKEFYKNRENRKLDELISYIEELP